jgi:hypothetical protein
MRRSDCTASLNYMQTKNVRALLKIWKSKNRAPYRIASGMSRSLKKVKSEKNVAHIWYKAFPPSRSRTIGANFTVKFLFLRQLKILLKQLKYIAWSILAINFASHGLYIRRTRQRGGRPWLAWGCPAMPMCLISLRLFTWCNAIFIHING